MSRLALMTRSVSTAVRLLQFLIAALILGIFSYYLAFLSKHSLTIPQWEKAVEGMSGAAVIYTAFAVILTCFLGGITIFAFIAVFLDVLFCGCFVAIAILTRGGAKACGGVNSSPIGDGQYQSCQLQRAAFIVAIVNALLFLISAGLQIALSRSHKREKRYGPSPANNYTSGSGKRKFWARKNRKNRDAELGTLGAAGGLATADEHEHHKHNGINGINGGMHDPALTGTAVDGGYGGPDNKYATREPTIPPSSTTHTATSTMTGYTPQGTGYQSTGYTPQHHQHQTSGVTGGGAGTSVPEMPANTHVEGGGYMHQGNGPLHRGDLP